MGYRRSPSKRWNTEHGSKIVHKYWLGALVHMLRLTVRDIRKDRTVTKMKVYACKWGQWYNRGETAPKHYHVGRSYKYGEVVNLKDRRNA